MKQQDLISALMEQAPCIVLVLKWLSSTYCLDDV